MLPSLQSPDLVVSQWFEMQYIPHKYCHLTVIAFSSNALICLIWIMCLYLGDPRVNRSGINDCRLAALHFCAIFPKPLTGIHSRLGILLNFYNSPFQHARETCDQTHGKWTPGLLVVLRYFP